MVFDLDAFIADAEGEPFLFTFGGVEFTWPGGVDFRVTTRLGNGDLFGALELLNGSQHEKFMAAWEGHSGVLDTKIIQALFGKHAEHVGSSLGESSVSSASSKSTEKRSRPTSSTTTKKR